MSNKETGNNGAKIETIKEWTEYFSKHHEYERGFPGTIFEGLPSETNQLPSCDEYNQGRLYNIYDMLQDIYSINNYYDRPTPYEPKDIIKALRFLELRNPKTDNQVERVGRSNYYWKIIGEESLKSSFPIRQDNNQVGKILQCFCNYNRNDEYPVGRIIVYENEEIQYIHAPVGWALTPKELMKEMVNERIKKIGGAALKSLGALFDLPSINPMQQLRSSIIKKCHPNQNRLQEINKNLEKTKKVCQDMFCKLFRGNQLKQSVLDNIIDYLLNCRWIINDTFTDPKFKDYTIPIIAPNMPLTEDAMKELADSFGIEIPEKLSLYGRGDEEIANDETGSLTYCLLPLTEREDDFGKVNTGRTEMTPTEFVTYLELTMKKG